MVEKTPSKGGCVINGLDLFSGIGGLSLALAPWVRPIAYCENDRHAQSVLLARMADGLLVNAPIWDDVRTLRAQHLPQVDMVYGGFPCQDVSLAGARKGVEAQRTGLFREAIRLIRECQPKLVFFENVEGIKKFVHVIRSELETLGYYCRDGFLSAKDIGANHKRNRWWLLAHSNRILSYPKQICAQKCEGPADFNRNGKKESLAYSKSIGAKRLSTRSRPEGKGEAYSFRSSETFPHSTGKRSQKSRPVSENPSSGNRYEAQSQSTGSYWSPMWWKIEPNVGRVANGVPFRVDRLRGLGNAVVPLQARTAFEILMGLAHV